ncbi:MAG: hypothetical protein BroJett031_14070 [Betaproteobacteria bacterium]|nr:MAG: hypothetical protein BroJett031_14070 [Betaproteobacteria bacterium]
MKPRSRSYDPFARLPTLSPPARETAPAAPVRRAPDMRDRSVLETRYPGMAHAITLLWGHPEMNEYFRKLWLADGSQTPLEPDAMSELMLLAQVHLHIVPEKLQRTLASIYGTAYSAPAKRDVWEDVTWRR